METTSWHEKQDRSFNIRCKLENHFMDAFSPEVFRETVDKVSTHIANHIIEQYGAEIMAKISPEAIANMTIAAAGAKINETLNKKMPDKILEVERIVHEPAVLQRGILGGLKRVI